LIFLAADEPRAAEIARALAAAAPDVTVAFCPGSDALPGRVGAAIARQCRPACGGAQAGAAGTDG
jgi:hypothetical protein